MVTTGTFGRGRSGTDPLLYSATTLKEVAAGC